MLASAKWQKSPGFGLPQLSSRLKNAIASGTPDGIIVSWNPGAQQMYGYTEAEAVGKPISILIPPELSDEEATIFETLKMGGRIEQFETVRVTKTGKELTYP
jgi:PAS domain S-box-containing protein